MKQVLVNFAGNLRETKIISNFLNLSSIQLSNALILILMYPIITRIIGIDNFGMMMLANTFSGLAGIAINYGTNQSGIRDVAMSTESPISLSRVLFITLFIRLIIFILLVLMIIGLYWFHIRYYSFIIMAIPLVVAEVVNPLFFFTGTEKLKTYNVTNLISKVIVVSAILLMIKRPEDAIWVNTIIGTSSTIAYITLLFIARRQFKLQLIIPHKSEMIKIGKENFFLTINNVSVQLQQSLMVFALAKWGSPSWLGAYSLCDKVIWSTRIMIISVSNAIYPKAAQLYQEGARFWRSYMKKMKILIAVVFLIGSLIIFIFPNFCIHLISGENNKVGAIFLRVMAFVPTVAALNSLNVVDLLLENKTKMIFNISIVLFVFAFISAIALVKIADQYWIGAYTLIIECTALLLYEFVIKRSRQNG